MATSGSLTDMNTEAHERIDELALAFLEAVTELSLEEAAGLFKSFEQALFTHLRFEDDEVLPVVERLHAIHGDPSHPLPKQLEGDHRILERTVQKAEASLLRLRRADAHVRRAMVLELDAFLLLRRVLEHHDQREARFAYPLLDAHVTDAERASLTAGLARTLPSS